MVAEVIHGQHVADPYRRLEDATDPQTKAWSAAQDQLFESARAGWPDRAAFAGRLDRLFRTGAVGSPRWRGERSFALRRDPDQEHAVLVVTEPGRPDRVLIDPAAADPSGTTTLDTWSPSKEGDLVAYAMSESGTEWAAVRVLDVATGEIVDGPISRTRHPSIAWLPGGRAFYYPRYLSTADTGPDRLRQRLCRHELGTDPDTDELVFGADLPRATYLGASTSDDGRWLAVTASRGTDARNDAWLHAVGGTGFTPVSVGRDSHTYPFFDARGDLYVLTNTDAPRWRVCRVDGAVWIDVIPQDPAAVVHDAAVLADAGLVVAVRSRHAVSEVTVHEMATGAPVRELRLPGLGSVTDLSERDSGTDVWFGYTDFTTPGYVLRADAATGEISTHARPPGAPPEPVPTRQVTYRSYDGTAVRMFLIGEAGAPKPTILTGYGGFNIALTPAYAPLIAAWVSAGGVYAVANLRGGSEEGEAWHRAGMREHKQNVFDDFAAASDWLVGQGVTRRDRLGIYGRSNGGLLVGAALTRHPEKYAAVVCAAPLLDMLRYERFGLGEMWNGEYGTVADPVEFGWLRAYSPYHNVTAGTDYPATLFVVFEGDTRVDPLHARKMCALLQDSAAGTRPILIRREPGVGHAGRAVSRDIDLAADELAFLSAQLGGA